MENCRVIFKPSNKEVSVPKGTDLLTAASKAGIYIYNVCGGEGLCGKCKVKVLKGKILSEPTRVLSEKEIKEGYALACQCDVESDATIEIPEESVIEKPAIVIEEVYTPAEKIEKPAILKGERKFHHGPLVTKHYFQLPKPTAEDNISDLDRLYREINKIVTVPVMQMGVANVRRLGKLLRESDWKVTATLGKRDGTVEIVLIEPGDTTKKNYGIAVDVGTTTVVAYLVDLNTEETVAASASYNRQSMFGEDVITRIVYAGEPGGLENLHEAIVGTINDLIRNAVKESNVSISDINAVVAAGNTTMTHILLMIPPDDIRKEPYVPAVSSVPVIRAAETGIKVNPRGLLKCLPGVASYVGGDVTAGVLSTGIDKTSELSLLIDLGTNGELALGNKEWLVCCACSAGPAFEGVGIKSGIRAMDGAIQRMTIENKKGDDFDVQYSTIGDKKPKGICGSGFIDLIAELLKAGAIDRQGKITKAGSARIRKDQESGSMEFVVAFAKETSTNKDIAIAETDILNLIRSKGAVYMGIHVLLQHVGFKFEDLKKIYISGGLGTYLDTEKAIMIGLLPDLPVERFLFVGNSSIAGAKKCLVSNQALKEADEIAKRMTYFELSTDPKFMNEYTSTLFLPHTDLELFPSVKKVLGK